MKYPIGIQNFESLRKDGYLYIDKTEFVHKLVSEGRYYFLSRPRRFGKSLLISTLESYFQGKRELFEGLAIEKLEKEWTARPVLHIDLNIERYNKPENLHDILNYTLCIWEKLYGCDPSETSLSLRFAGIIRRAHEQTGHRVAILVDEYDKPLLQAIGNKPLQEEYRNILKPFYGVLKTMDGHIRFAMLTGVTKFGKVSVFSDLNNLNDISMLPQYVSICGLTESEIHQYMEEGIQNLADTRTVRRIPLHTGLRGHIQSLQHSPYHGQRYLRKLLVRDRHTHISRHPPQAGQMRPERDGLGRHRRRDT